MDELMDKHLPYFVGGNLATLPYDAGWNRTLLRSVLVSV